MLMYFLNSIEIYKPMQLTVKGNKPHIVELIYHFNIGKNTIMWLQISVNLCHWVCLINKNYRQIYFSSCLPCRGPSEQGGPSFLGICLFCDQNSNIFFFKKQNLIFVVSHYENIPQIPEERVFQI